MLWGSNFNGHHPLWDRDQDNCLFTLQALWYASTLIQLVVNEGIKIALLKGEPTLKHMVTNLYSQPDNVWCSTEILHAVVR